MSDREDNDVDENADEMIGGDAEVEEEAEEEEIRADELGDDDDKSLNDDNEEETEKQEEEEKDPDIALMPETMSECLSIICKTGDGLAHAYVRFDATERGLTDISTLASYVHLHYINLSKNNLRDVSALNSLSHLLTVQLDNNKLTTADIPKDLPYLQSISFSGNKIKTMAGIGHPLLERLILNQNEISVVDGIEPSHLANLQTLELRGNKLTTLNGLNLPTLKNLYLAANEITSLQGIEQLEGLTTFHIRENQLQTLDGLSRKHQQLKYINMRTNNIADMKEVKKLAVLPKLTDLVLAENPVSEEDDYRLEVLVALRSLDRLDKEKFLEDEKEEAARISEERKQDEELLAADDDTAKDDIAENVTSPRAEE